MPLTGTNESRSTPTTGPTQTMKFELPAETDAFLAHPLVTASAADSQLEALAAPNSQRRVSCVIPCYNEAANLDDLLSTLQQRLDASGLRWEVIVIDDGSSDDTATVAGRWCEDPGFRCIVLSRNFGKEAAITAGLEAAHGDAVILLDGDHQHSPTLIDVMLSHWLGGAEVVYTVRARRDEETLFKRVGTDLFYRLINSSHRFSLPKDAGDFRLMDRKVVDALLQLPERGRFMKGLYAWVGFRAVAIAYTPQPRTSGKTNYGAMRLFNFAIDGLTSFTTWPLRMVSVVGLLMALPAFAYGAYLLAEYLIVGNQVSGWTTIVVTLMFFIGIQLISTGIVGEYVARIFEEVKGRPIYVVDRQMGEGLGGPGP